MLEEMIQSFVQRREPAPPEEYGNLRLSVQVGPSYYCEYDRERDIYVNAEVAILHNGSIVRPETVGLPLNICALFEPGEGPVAGRVPWAMIDQIREMLKSIDRMRSCQTPIR